MKSRRAAGMLIAGMLGVFCSPLARGQQGLPPGPGRTALGTGALFGRSAWSGALAWPEGGINWRICSQHPFGVPDLEYREGWVL